MSINFPIGLVGKRAYVPPLNSKLYDSGNNVLIELAGDIPNFWNDDNAPYVAAKIEIGTSCTSIGQEAFKYSNQITGDLFIPDSVTSISKEAFLFCQFDGKLTIGSGLASISNDGQGVFTFNNAGFSELTVDLSNPSYSDNDQNILYNKDLTEIVTCAQAQTGTLIIPNSVTSILQRAFGKSDFTGELIIPDSVTSMGTYVFNGSSGFTSLSIGSGLSTIPQGTFLGCTGFTGDLIIPNNITNIESLAFSSAGFDGLLTTGTGLSTLQIYAFRSSKFTTVSISNSVTFVGYGCFRNCTNLTAVYIDTPVSSWSSSQAFRDCPALTNIYVSPTYVAGYDAAWKTSQQTTATVSTWSNYPNIP